MKYGSSAHYLGDKGKAYFNHQNKNAALGATLNRSKFSQYVHSSDRVLDFGCGGGWLLAELECSERIGVEMNKAAHEICRANGVKVYESIETVEESDLDAVISHHCLEHVPFPIEALSSLRKLLKVGGILVLIVPIDDWRVQRDHTGEDIDHHLHTWTPRLLANTLVEAGYKVETLDVMTHAWFPGWRKLLGKIPQPLFNVICRFWSSVRKTRQLVAVARNSN